MLPECELNWIKIMDFLLVANCLAFPIFYYPYFSNENEFTSSKTNLSKRHNLTVNSKN